MDFINRLGKFIKGVATFLHVAFTVISIFSAWYTSSLIYNVIEPAIPNEIMKYIVGIGLFITIVNANICFINGITASLASKQNDAEEVEDDTLDDEDGNEKDGDDKGTGTGALLGNVGRIKPTAVS